MTEERNVTFNIVKHFAVLADGMDGWHKELNLVSWNGCPAKFDIREWSPDHTRMSRGLTFTKEEMMIIQDVLNEDIIFFGSEK